MMRIPRTDTRTERPGKSPDIEAWKPDALWKTTGHSHGAVESGISIIPQKPCNAAAPPFIPSKVEIAHPELMSVDEWTGPKSLDPRDCLISPYEGETVTIKFGGPDMNTFAVPKRTIDKFPTLRYARTLAGTLTLWLFEVNKDCRHTFVHYLYTGEYQTVPGPLGSLDSEKDLEFAMAIHAYKAAVLHGIHGLAECAKKRIKAFDKKVPTLEIIHLVQDSLPRITNDPWLSDYLRNRIMQRFKSEENLFQQEEFWNAFGQYSDFSVFLAKVMAQAYGNKVSDIRREKTMNTIKIEKHLRWNDDQGGVEIKAEPSPDTPDVSSRGSSAGSPSNAARGNLPMDDNAYEELVRVLTRSSETALRHKGPLTSSPATDYGTGSIDPTALQPGQADEAPEPSATTNSSVHVSQTATSNDESLSEANHRYVAELRELEGRYQRLLEADEGHSNTLGELERRYSRRKRRKSLPTVKHPDSEAFLGTESPAFSKRAKRGERSARFSTGLLSPDDSGNEASADS